MAVYRKRPQTPCLWFCILGFVGVFFVFCLGFFLTHWQCSWAYPTELLGNNYLFRSWDCGNEKGVFIFFLKSAFSAKDSSLLLPLQATASDNPQSWQVLEAIGFSLLEKEDFIHL